MGFRLPEKTVRLVFEGTEYAGAEVRLRANMPVGLYLDAAAAKASGDLETVLRFLADALIDWNLEDHDGPLPVGMDGLRKLGDLEFLMLLLREWDRAVQGAVATSPLLTGPSSNGAISTTTAS